MIRGPRINDSRVIRFSGRCIQSRGEITYLSKQGGCRRWLFLLGDKSTKCVYLFLSECTSVRGRTRSRCGKCHLYHINVISTRMSYTSSKTPLPLVATMRSPTNFLARLVLLQWSQTSYSLSSKVVFVTFPHHNSCNLLYWCIEMQWLRLSCEAKWSIVLRLSSYWTYANISLKEEDPFS